jgi:hypothetical protein
MADTAAFIATLGLKLEGFEQELKRANQLADRQLDAMEKGFSARNLALGVGLGSAIERAVSNAVRGAIGQVKNLYDEILALDRVARTTGVALTQVFSLGEQMRSLGQAEKFIDNIATQLDRMQRGEKNALSKLFDENGVKNITNASEAADKTLTILRNLNANQAQQTGKLFGLDPVTIDRVNQGMVSFGRVSALSQTEAEKLVASARRFDEAWNTATLAVKSYLINLFAPGSSLSTGLQFLTEQLVKLLRLSSDLAAALPGEGMAFAATKWKEAADSLESSRRRLRLIPSLGRQDQFPLTLEVPTETHSSEPSIRLTSALRL